MRSLSKHQVRRLLSSVDLMKPFGERDYLLMLFLYHTGLRVGELSGLLVAHVATREKQPRHQLDLPAMICKGTRGRVIPLNSVARGLCVQNPGIQARPWVLHRPSGTVISESQARSSVCPFHSEACEEAQVSR